uniref:SWIM-type domain-containing protein n=1 Tax=Odontella aurita TaxID=265563 RepID=A0A7S4JKA3_9STRA|mmetsp:Transcript_4791/g.13548  ORF Transcript_4791/g.13548 Transcript_4791/m.13548 type:complete len:255 (+) Transcript_4791:673-1437(+)
MDKRNPSMLKSLGAFIEYDGAVGILIEGKIRASMKGKLYDGAVAFTADSLIACSCSCKAGSEGKERITCVHTIVKLYMLYMFLIDCFLDHMVHELSAEWSQQKEDALDGGRREKMKIALRTIVSAAGLDEKLVGIDESKLKSATGILSAFTVGTEQRKLAPTPPDPLKLGPFRTLKSEIKSQVAAAAEIVEMAEEKKRKGAQDAARAAAGYVHPSASESARQPDGGSNSTSNCPAEEPENIQLNQLKIYLSWCQ